MLILFLDHKGLVSGRLFIEKAFKRDGDYITNTKSFKAKSHKEIYGLVLYTTDDIEMRLLGDQKELLVNAYPDSLSEYYFTMGYAKLFPIEALTIPIYGKWHYKTNWEPPTEELPYDYIDKRYGINELASE